MAWLIRWEVDGISYTQTIDGDARAVALAERISKTHPDIAVEVGPL